MRVEAISLVGVLGYSDRATMPLPERGVVLITGPNGSGKSAWVEAVSVALWGETIRGTPPWHAGSHGEVEVSLTEPRAGVRRCRTAKGTVTLSVNGENAATTTKGQEALNAVVGAAATWQATHVVSAQDVGRFTRATDGERKRFLESLLGLAAFDAALAKCRAELKTVAAEKTARERNAERLAEGRTAEERRAADARAALAQTVAPNPEHGERIVQLQSVLNDLHAMRQNASGRADKLRAQIATAQADVRTAERDNAKFRLGTCPTCGAELTDAQAKCFDADARLSRGLTALSDLTAAIQRVDAELRGIDEEEQEANAAWREVSREQERANADARARAHAEQVLADSERRLAAYGNDIATETAAAETANARLQLLLDAEKALGLQGIRAHVLGESLDGIQSIANGWLARIAGSGMRLELSPSTEKASGGVKDAISLEVVGAGGGYGYRAASLGQQRRIDVALLFALADISAAATARAPGTLWCDEILAGLDADGREAVCGALVDLARDRCVVVISHDDDAAELLRPARHVRVLDGTITQEVA